MKIIERIVICLLVLFILFVFLWSSHTAGQSKVVVAEKGSSYIALELKNTPDYTIPTPPIKRGYKHTTAPLTAEQLAIRDKIMAAFPDKPVMWDIANAESGYRNICNKNSSACGPYQILRSTYKYHCGDPVERLDVDKNIACAKKIAQNNPSLSDWSESAGAW